MNGVHYKVLNESFSGDEFWSVAVGHVCVTDPLTHFDVHHEMDSAVCSHHVYKSVWLPATEEHLVLEKEPASHSTRWICSAVIKDSQIVGHILSEKIIHRSHGILFHKEVPSAVILLGEGGKEKAYKFTM